MNTPTLHTLGHVLTHASTPSALATLPPPYTYHADCCAYTGNPLPLLTVAQRMFPRAQVQWIAATHWRIVDSRTYEIIDNVSLERLAARYSPKCDPNYADADPVTLFPFHPDNA